jgi:hypothetical protein
LTTPAALQRRPRLIAVDLDQGPIEPLWFKLVNPENDHAKINDALRDNHQLCSFRPRRAGRKEFVRFSLMGATDGPTQNGHFACDAFKLGPAAVISSG